FKSALSAAQSLANLTGMDLPGAAELLGRTLEDPEAMMSRFQRSTHIHFTEQMKKNITAMQQSGNITGAQETLMAQIPKIALPETIFTDLQRLRREFVDAGVTIGDMFLPSVRSAINVLSEWTTSFNKMS